VTYVANIDKYYIAYTLLTEADARNVRRAKHWIRESDGDIEKTFFLRTRAATRVRSRVGRSRPFIEELIMKQLLLAISAAALTFGTPFVLADDTSLINDMNMKTLTPEQSAQLRAERDAAKAKWATMTPAEQAAATQAMKSKKVADMNHMDKMAQDNDMTAMTKSETAQDKAAREAAQAKFAAMTPAEQAATRKAAQQKRLAEMNAMEKASQNNDMGRYMSH
jgi:hypothetical protein